MKFAKDYYHNTVDLLQTISTEEEDLIEKAGTALAEVFRRDGLLYVFGCGHSHMIQEELFFRAGGLAPISPIFETSTMLHEGAVKSSQIERMSGYAQHVLNRYPLSPADALLISSTSGINSFPIEMAQAAKMAGAIVIGISSLNYIQSSSRQKDGLHLPDVCDIVIDNHVPVGDASVQINPDGTRSGPLSTLASIFIANQLVLTACEKLIEWGIEPPVYKSGNCPDGDQYNADLIARYKLRIRHL
ncbi:MAG: SIS domain-containing protein [Anaerolineaceae bacterium]